MSNNKVLSASKESSEGMVLSDKNFVRIRDRYNKTIDIPKNKHEKQILLCPVGLVGSGKTTVVKKLCDKLNLLRISTDEIRLELRKDGFNFERTAEIAYMLIMRYLKEGYSIGIDADCISPDVQGHLEKLEKEFKVTPVWIHISTPEKEIVYRMKKGNISNFHNSSELAISEYERRKPLHEKYLNQIEFYYSFNSSGNIESDVEKFSKKIKNQFDIT